MYTKLSHVNATLRALGERPVNSLDTIHPEVPAILRDLDNKSIHLQSEGWWFNVERPRLEPLPDGSIRLGPNVLSVDLLDTSPAVAYRAGLLYNLTDSTHIWESAVSVRLVRHVEFDDLPISARFYVSSSALVDTLSGLDADGSKISSASRAESRAYQLFHAEHIRNTQANMMDRATFAYRIREVVGNTPYTQRYVR